MFRPFRTILPVLLGSSVFIVPSVFSHEWPEGTFTYTMDHDSQGHIGTQTLISKRIGHDVYIKITEQVDVSKWGIAIYHSQAERWEKWRNNQLVFFKSTTQETCSHAATVISFVQSAFGGEEICLYDRYAMPMEVRAWLAKQGTIIQQAGLQNEQPPCTSTPSTIFTANFFNLGLVQHAKPVLLIDSTTGNQKEREIEPVSMTSLSERKSVGTNQYFVYRGDPATPGDPTREVWYDDNGIWAGMRVEENRVTITLQSVSQQNAISPEEWRIPTGRHHCRETSPAPP